MQLNAAAAAAAMHLPCTFVAAISYLQVKANVQTVLEALGLVDNKTAAQDAKALQEVTLCFAMYYKPCSPVCGCLRV